MIKEFDYTILGESWKIMLLYPTDFYLDEDADALAVTDTDLKTIKFQTPELKLNIVIHEVTHVILDSQIRDYDFNEEDDYEEFICNITGKYNLHINDVSVNIFKLLGGNLEDDKTCYRGV